MSQHLLCISRTFPPVAGIGSMRPAGFIRHLPEFGWIPHVVTVHPKSLSVASRDDSLLSYIPEDYDRLNVSDFMEELYQFLRSMLTDRLTLFTSKSPPKKLIQAVSNRKGTKIGYFFRLFSLPNISLIWALNAVYKCRYLIKSCDAVYACGLPLGSHIAAILIARFAKKPVVCDFRDPYIWPGVRKFPTRLHELIGKWLEKIIVSQSDAVITIGDKFCDSFKLRYPCYSNKIFSIMNGYDGDLLAKSTTCRDTLKILHAGTINNNRALEVLVAAIEYLHVKKIKVHLELVGSLDISQHKIIDNSTAAECIIKYGRLPHLKAIEKMQNADILFLESCGMISDIAIRAKVFEYIRCQSIILAITEKDSAINRLLNKYKIGYTFSCDQIDPLKNLLQSIASKKINGESLQHDVDHKNFSRRNSTKQLSELLSIITNK